jgi:multidrug efflux pump subunit AcrB
LVKKIYGAVVQPFLDSRGMRWGLLVVILLMLAGSMALAVLRLVPLKMLPFDNKNEFQIVLDLPESASLEHSSRVVQDFEEYLTRVPEVSDFTPTWGHPRPWISTAWCGITICEKAAMWPISG